MATKLELAWKCHGCGEIYNNEDDAYECCLPEVSEGYLCPECGDYFRKEADALDCCGYDDEAPPQPPTEAELEAAGQQRLFA